MTDAVLDTPLSTFIQVAEVWLPEGDRLSRGLLDGRRVPLTEG